MPRSRLKHLFRGVSAMTKSRLTLLASMLMVLLPVSLEAQWARAYGGKGKIVWQKAYGGPKADYGNSVCPTADGGLIVAEGTPEAVAKSRSSITAKYLRKALKA